MKDMMEEIMKEGNGMELEINEGITKLMSTDKQQEGDLSNIDK